VKPPYYFFHYCDQIPVRNNVKEERFVLVHGLRGAMVLGPMSLGRISWWQEYVAGETVDLMVDGKQRTKKGLGTRYNLQAPPTPHNCDLLPPTRPYLPKFSLFPKIASSSGGQALNT
jgi:hypothetical protein